MYHKTVILKTCSQLDIEQLGMCTARFGHKDKNAKCKLFVVPENSPALLWMLDIELLNVLKIMCKVIDNPHESRKFDSKTVEASDSPSCRTNKATKDETDKVDAHDKHVNMPDYFRSSTNRVADKKLARFSQIRYIRYSMMFFQT